MINYVPCPRCGEIAEMVADFGAVAFHGDHVWASGVGQPSPRGQKLLDDYEMRTA